MREVIAAHNADVICLSEAHSDFLDGPGHILAADPDYGYPVVPGRRKVLLWSRRPWTEIDPVGDPVMPPGRFIAGTTTTPAGPMRVAGICIPWQHAHVSTGRRDRMPWQDHRAYLAGLARLIQQHAASAPMVIMGDFNQTVPRTRAPRTVHDALLTALGSGLKLVTAGPIAGLEAPAIDHVAHGEELSCESVLGIPRHLAGRRLSDHDGVVVCLTSRQ